MSDQEIYQKFEQDKYLKHVVECSLFYAINPYGDENYLYFINDLIPIYSTKSEIDFIRKSDNKRLINLNSLIEYIKISNINSNEFDRYLEIKNKQEEYKFNHNMHNCVLGLIPTKLLESFNQDINYLYNNNYKIYTYLLWSLLELLYFYSSFDKVLSGLTNKNLSNNEILYLIMYLSKYVNILER